MPNFFTKAILLIILIAACKFLSAQQMPGLSNSNYAGIHGVLVNPSQTADSRYGFYLNMGGAHFTANTSFFKSLSSDALTFPLRLPFKKDLYAASQLSGAVNPLQGLQAYSEVIGPSLMIKLSQHNGFSLFTRYRSMIRGKNIPSVFTWAIRMAWRKAADLLATCSSMPIVFLNLGYPLVKLFFIVGAIL